MVYSKITNDIRVTVAPTFLPAESDPEDSRFVFAYHVRIENCGGAPVQLRQRYWRIVDGQGRVFEVQGMGVIGEQPTIRPGESYEYTSGTPLTTPGGFMTGHYGMQTEQGEKFDVKIPTFSLDSPYQNKSLH